MQSQSSFTNSKENKMIKSISTKNLILVLLFLLLGGIFIAGCNKESTLLSRDAKNSDIDFNLSNEFSLNIEYKITPRVDINNLEITFKYYDKNNNLLTTKIKNVGNVEEGIEYSITVSLTEFSFLDIFKLHSVSARVTGGTVSYFA